ncbi:unnamed protein product [Phaedon cochleariae]|uniref:Uncharacterized protein n=1 Tax=Phaedon cochleariae TaxID=80249 RepID=A0A9N9X5R3_PHACE|nr:unnamed protein product [Phaedon cochleariae]
MEKDTGHFCYDPYPTVSKQNTSSLNGDPSKKTKEAKCCCCFGKRTKRRSKAFLAGLATNLVIFLAIEGGSSYQHQILATTSLSTNINNHKKHTNQSNQSNQSVDMKARTDEARAKTVENIWDITVSLNILYRDNWTRLAAEEITRFQEEILKTMAEEMALQQPLQVANHREKHHPDPYEWSFAKAFLYSLTVLTTIGE